MEVNTMTKYEVTTTIRNNENKPITSFTFDTAKGGQLTVNGPLANNVCGYLNMDFSEKMSAVLKGKIFADMKRLDIDWKNQYGVKSAKQFMVNMLAIDGSQFDNYSLAYERFFDGDSPKLACIDELNMGKLIILGKYFTYAGKSFDDDNMISDYALQLIDRDFSDGTINRFMSDKAFESAVKKSLETVNEAEQKHEQKSEDKKPEQKPEQKSKDKKPEQKPEQKPTEPKDMINEQSVMYTALKKLGTAMDLYESIKGMEIKTEKERKLEAVIKAFVSASEYTMEIFK